jgi:glycosyltransferase involved in cell wall biosynthesis
MTVPVPERVVLLHDFSEALGGASYLVQVLIGQLRDRGIPVTFIAGDSGTRFHREDVELVALHGKALLERSRAGALTKGFFNHRAYRTTRDWIARHDTPGTVYHLHGWSKILTPAVFAALHGVAGRLILHGHDYFNGCPNGAFFNYVTQRDCMLDALGAACLRSRCDKASHAQKLWRSGREGLRRALQRGGANASRLLMIHPGQKDQFLRGQWPANKLFPVRNPVSPLSPHRVPAERNRGVIFIGRISAEKGADLAAMAAARACLPITFVGEGSEIARIRRLNPDAAFLGRLNRAGVARALARARVAVMPSRWAEPFGLVALEAIGSGVPAVVSDRALVAGEIERAGIGRAVDTADIDAFAGTLAALHAEDEAVAAMSRAGFERYLHLCNTEADWAEEIVRHYREVLAASGGHWLPSVPGRS